MGVGLMDRLGRPIPATTAHTLREWAGGVRDGALSRREFLSLASSFGLGAAASYGLLGLPAAAQAQGGDPAPRKGGVLRVSMAVRPLGDPRLFEWPESAEIARQICEPLVRYRADGVFEPWLLRGWDVSPDASEYVLRLRTGASWTNGDPFTAEDVVATLTRWCARDVVGNSMADRMAALIDPATGALADGAVEALDDHTLRLRLRRPDVSLIAAFTDYPALVTHRGFDAAGADLARAPLGTGPFELTAYEEGVRAEAKRRENGAWWGGEAWLDSVEWRDFSEDPEGERRAFEQGALDLNYETAPERREALDALGLVNSEAASAETVVIRANAQAPELQDPRVRKALQLAVDNVAVIEAALPGDAEPAEHHHVWPGHPEYAALPAPLRDLEEARRLLQEAGQEALELKLISVDDDYRRRTADAVAAQIGETGLTVGRVILPSRIFWTDWRTHPFSITPWRMRPLAVQTLALAYRSDAVWNESGFADPVFDALLDVASEVADLEARRVVMRRLQRRLQSSGAIIQPYWRKTRRHHTKRVRGLGPHPMLEQHLESVFLAD